MLNVLFTTLFAQYLNINEAVEKIFDTQWKIYEKQDFISLKDPENESFEIVMKKDVYESLFFEDNLFSKIYDKSIDLSKWNFSSSEESNPEEHGFSYIFSSPKDEEVILKYSQKKIKSLLLPLVK